VPHRAAPTAAVLLLALVSLASDSPESPADKGGAAGPAKPETVELRGRVSAPDGKPVAGATIRVLPEPKPSKVAGEHASTEATVVDSREDGTFVAGSLVGALFLVRVEADGFAPFFEAHVPGGTSLDVRLVAGQALSGTVLDLRSGTPLVGATVTVCDAGAAPFGRDACREARSGEGGTFRLADLPRGAVDVEALADGHAVGRMGNVAVPPLEADDRSPRRLEIHLSPGALWGGQVVNGDNQPIEGATVTLELSDPEHPELVERERRSETTDAAGRFSFEGVPLDARFRVQGSAEGYASTDMAAGPDMTIRLHLGATVDVRLLDATDVPVETLEVEFDSSDDANRGFLPMDPDLIESLGEGRFRVTRLPAGTYAVRLLPEGFADVERENVVLREGGSVDLGTIVVREGETIAGTVTNDAGEPIARAEIRALFEREGLLIRRAVRTSVEGKYRVPGLGEEPARLSVSAEGHGTDERSGLLPGAEDIDFVLERTGSVVGRIVLEGGGVPPVSQVRAHLETGDDPGQSVFLTLLDDLEDKDAGAFSDLDGRYRVDELAPGTYTIEAIAQGLAPGRATGLRVTSAGVTDAGSIVLERGMTIRGRVLDAGDDSPVAGATVSVGVPSAIDTLLRAPGLNETAVTGSDGRFRVEGIAAGPHDVSVEHPEFAPAESRVAVEDGVDPPEIIVRLSKGGTITGTVRDATGRSIPEGRVVLKNGRGDDRTTTTGVDGRYVFERLSPSTYSLSRAGPGAPTGVQHATVEEGETVVVDFGGAPAVRLEGLVLRGGEPAAGALLRFMRHGGGVIETARSEADGAYEVGLPAAGTYSVVVRTGPPGGPAGGILLMLTVPDEPEVTRDLVFATSGITGIVLDAEGRSISNAMVIVEDATTAGGGSTMTDSSGAYVVEGLEAGNYRVTVSASGFQPAERFADVPDTRIASGIDFRLEPGRRLRGRVVDPLGRGLGGAIVVVRASTEDPFAEPALTDVNGRFTAGAPGEGSVGVGVYAEGWAPAWRTGIVPREGEETTIVLSPGGKIEIRVLGADGRPVPGVGVKLVALGADPDGEKLFGTRQPPPTGIDGVALADSLVPGTYELWVTNRRGVAPVQVAVTEGRTTAVVLNLP